MNRELLEAEICADPDDLNRWAVYGDWLLEQNDVRGEIIAYESEIRRLGETAERRARIESILEQHRDAWLGDTLSSALRSAPAERFQLVFSHGFLSEARISLFEEEPYPERLLLALLERPCARFLTRLVLGVFELGDSSNRYLEAIEAIVASAPLPALRDLVIGDYDRAETQISWTTVGPLDELLAHTPALRSLRARGGEIRLCTLRHRCLERLIFESGGLPKETARAVASGEAPRLTHLELWFGSPDYGGDASIDVLEPLWRSKGYPSLAHLGLRNCAFANELATAVVKAPLLAQLRTLDLSMGTMTEQGATVLLSHSDRLRHLDRIVLGRNYIDSSILNALHRALGDAIEMGQQNFPYLSSGEDAYYVSVSE